MLKINTAWCQFFLTKIELNLLKKRAENDPEKSLLLVQVNDLCVAFVRSFFKNKAEKARFDKSNRAQNRQTRGKYRSVPFSWIKNQRNKLKKCGIIVNATKQAMQKFRKDYETSEKEKKTSNNHLSSIHSSSGIQ